MTTPTDEQRIRDQQAAGAALNRVRAQKAMLQERMIALVTRAMKGERFDDTEWSAFNQTVIDNLLMEEQNCVAAVISASNYGHEDTVFTPDDGLAVDLNAISAAALNAVSEAIPPIDLDTLLNEIRKNSEFEAQVSALFMKRS